jgi:hypothetical protein
MDKVTWISLHEPLASTRILPCQSSTTHQGIALKQKTKILSNSADHMTLLAVTEMLILYAPIVIQSLPTDSHVEITAKFV